MVLSGAVLCPTSEPNQPAIPATPTHQTHRKHDDMIEQRMQELSYELKVMRSSEGYQELDVAAEALYLVANEARDEYGETAFVFHLVADAARLKALSLQGRVSDTHVESVVTAVINRLDRQVSFVS